MMAVMLRVKMGCKRWVVTCAFVILAFGCLLHNSAYSEEMQKLQELDVQAPLSAPFTLELQGLQKAQRSSAGEVGKPYLLHLWATWCGPCRLELPQLAQFMQDHPGVPIVPVAVESGTPERVEAFLERLALPHFPVWVGDHAVVQTALSHLSDVGLPITLLVDGHGRVRAVSDGGIEWQDPQADHALQTLLREVQ